MRIALIQIGYEYHEKFPVWAKDALMAAIITDPVFEDAQYVPEFKEIEGKKDIIMFDGWHRKIVVDMDKMPQIPFEVHAVSKLTFRTTADFKESEGAAPINERVSVITPGNFLSEVADVKVVYDCCIDALREEILEGWRILAICPQPDQRRPDYVLGKKE